MNKKRVTEDFVSENFKLMGWEVYEPFTDTGIDRIISKKICPNGHTPLNESENEKCQKCGKKTIEIIRFIQIKTRSLKNSIFGFTLKSKDFRVDPRHIFLLYCDTTMDFLILSVYDYLKFFDDIGNNPFAATSFRKGNQKLNTLRYDNIKNKWSWSKFSWEKFRNLNGLLRIQNPKIDQNLIEWIKKIRELNNKLLLKFVPGGTYDQNITSSINTQLQLKLKKYSNKEKVVEIRYDILEYLKNTIKDKEIFNSIMKYWERIKNLEISSDF